MGTGSLVRRDLREQHRRCAGALANLWLLARSEGGNPLSARAVQGMAECIGVVLDEMRIANKLVIEACASDGDAHRGYEVLEARFFRAQTAASQINLSLRSGDIPGAQRWVQQFRVLVSALRQIQLDVHGH